MSITLDHEFKVNEDLRGLNLMNLPLESLHHVLSFMSIQDVINFAFVSWNAFQVAKGHTWTHLDFTGERCWLKDVVNLGNRAQASCRSLTLPVNIWYVRS